MMRAILTSVVFLSAAILVAPDLLAQAEQPPEPGVTLARTRKAALLFSGKMDLTFAYKSDEMFTATKGNGLDSSGNVSFVEPGLSNAERVYGTLPGVYSLRNGRDSSEFYLDPNLVLNFTVDVGDKARGVIELRTPFSNPDAGGKNTTPGTGFFANTENRILEVKQLYAEVDELLQPGANEPGSGLLLRAGIQDFRKDLRGDGNPFLIDVSGSEHPFDAFDPGGSLYGTPTYGAPMRYSTGFQDSTEAAGGYARYRVAFIDLDSWLFNLDEAYNAFGTNAVSPLVARRDLLFWGASTDIWFDSDKRLGKVFLTVFDLMNQSNTHIVTEGGGIVFNPFYSKETKVNFLQLYGEVYFQQGDYARHVPVNGAIGKVRQRDAYALNIGIMGKLPPMEVYEKKEFVPYAELSYVEVSGDDEADDSRNSNFVSLENNSRTVVVENGYYGYDFDTNYRGPRLAVGFNFAKFRFEVLYAYFELTDNGGNRISGGGSTSNKIGDEFDFTVGYEYSEALKLTFTNGWLLDSHALGQTEATMVSLFTVNLSF